MPIEAKIGFDRVGKLTRVEFEFTRLDTFVDFVYPFGIGGQVQLHRGVQK